MAADERSARVERLHEQLQEFLRALVTSDDWQRALAVAARFHDYSFANSQLIWSEATARGFTPTRVAGYRTWQQLGRQVRRGEKGLPILAPVTRKVDTLEGEEERRVVGFRVVHVFDLSQTDGKPLPEVRTRIVEGALPSHWSGVADLVTAQGFSLQVADLELLGEANGITDWRRRQVVVRQSLPGAQRFKTAVHELAHVTLHEPTSGDRPSCRGIVEVEAESVAYMVCAALGLDSAGYSLPYVATWSGGDLEKVASTADRVIRCARRVLTGLETEREIAREAVAAEVSPTTRDFIATESRESAAECIEGSPVEAHDPQLEEALRTAVVFYRDRLNQEDATEARTHLQRLGYMDDTLELWQIGWAASGWDTLVRALRSQGFREEVLLEAGLVGRARTGRVYDHLRGRIVFPIFDPAGSPRGFAGRLLAGDGPKYLNSPETPLYKKSALLYGMHLAAPTIASSGRAVVVEGYTDAIAAHQAGITNAVATGGTALTAQHVGFLRSAASTITLAFDGDQAGRNAVERAAELPDRLLDGLNVEVASLPDGADPGSLLTTGRSDVLEQAVENPVSLVNFLIDRLVARCNLDEPEAVVRALRQVSPLIERLTDSSNRAQAVGYLTARMGRDGALIAAALRSHERVQDRERSRAAGRTLS